MHLSAEDRNKIIEIAQKFGATAVSLFGSYAKGNAKQGSDIDILVEFEPGRSLFDLVRMERELSEKLGLEVDVVTPNSLHPRIRARIMEEKVSVL